MENISQIKEEIIKGDENQNYLINNNNNEISENVGFLNNSNYSFTNEAPIKLIDFEGSKFKLNPVALDFLKSITEDLVIVSVVGKARTGKSYLMNLLLDQIGKTKGVNYL